MSKDDNFKRGSAELLILTLLQEKDMYGYEMSQLISERSNAMISIPEGSLYVALYRMVKDGIISDSREIVGKRMRIYYHLEPAGRAKLVSERKEYEDVATGMRHFLDTSDLVNVGGSEDD